MPVADQENVSKSRYRPLDAQQRAAIEKSLLEHFFKKKMLYAREKVGSDMPPWLVDDLDAHVIRRYRFNVTQWIPWVERFCPISGATVVEIGCGTGSMISGFALGAGEVHGFDIDKGRRRSCQGTGPG
jgi:hypothetical protein